MCLLQGNSAPLIESNRLFSALYNSRRSALFSFQAHMPLCIEQLVVGVIGFGLIAEAFVHLERCLHSAIREAQKKKQRQMPICIARVECEICSGYWMWRSRLRIAFDCMALGDEGV